MESNFGSITLEQEDRRTMKRKIVIIDDHPALRQGLRIFIDSDSDFEICGEAEDSNSAIKILNEVNPDIAIVDISLESELAGLDLVRAISSRFPKVNILVLSMFDENIYAERCLRAGAKGYIMKSEAQEKILMAIKRIISGKIYLSEDIASIILEKLIHGNKDSQLDPVGNLSDKEFEVFQFVGKGLSSREIAREMNLSKNTIESHKRHIKEKLRLKGAHELIKFSSQWSILQKK